VAAAIRTPEISGAVSALSTHLDVRAELGARQRALIEAARTDRTSGGRGVVAEGRDITTVVAPDADVRGVLPAREDARLAGPARGARARRGAAVGAWPAAARAEVVGRDGRAGAVVESRGAADGVVTVDSSALTFEETVEAGLALVAEATGREEVR